MIGILDYSMGNLHSVYRAIQQIDSQLCVVNNASDLKKVHTLVVPGVGHFDLAIRNLEQKGLTCVIKEWIEKGNPYIGICLGMHILFEGSEEGTKEGLGIFKNKVRQLPTKVRPHMGWNRIDWQNSNWINCSACPNPWAYFVHSYGLMATMEKSWICATTNYENINLVAAMEKQNCFVMQFHPEKSAQMGLWLWKQIIKKAAS
jgi:glutamine amidotransferase